MSTAIDPVIAYRSELRRAAQRRIAARRRRAVILAAALAVMAVAAGFSIAATGWLTGDPAPEPVVNDFKAYTPQLGFHPEPGKAVFVAQDGEFKLYATTNREGTYCLVVDEPWKPPNAGDGGTCVLKRDAAAPITAGVIGGGSQHDGLSTWVVAGRVADADARVIRFTSPDGKEIERPLGASGFYLAPVETAAGCPSHDWEPTFLALGSNGKPVKQSTIQLVKTYPNEHACGGGVSPHGPRP